MANERLPLALFAAGVCFSYYIGSKIDDVKKEIDQKSVELHAKIDRKIDQQAAKIDQQAVELESVNRKIDQQAVELENVKNAIHLMSVQMGHLVNGKTNAD